MFLLLLIPRSCPPGLPSCSFWGDVWLPNRFHITVASRNRRDVGAEKHKGHDDLNKRCTVLSSWNGELDRRIWRALTLSIDCYRRWSSAALLTRCFHEFSRSGRTARQRELSSVLAHFRNYRWGVLSLRVTACHLLDGGSLFESLSWVSSDVRVSSWVWNMNFILAAVSSLGIKTKHVYRWNHWSWPLWISSLRWDRNMFSSPLGQTLSSSLLESDFCVADDPSIVESYRVLDSNCGIIFCSRVILPGATSW